MPDRTPYIVRYRSKELRAQPEPDKTELLASALRSAGDGWAGAAFIASSGPAAREISATADRVVIDFDSREVPALATDLTAAEADVLRGDPNVEEVEVDVWAHATPMVSAAGFLLDEAGHSSVDVEPGIQNAEQTPWGVRAVEAPRAWTTSLGGGIRVAVLDSGIDRLHPDPAPNYRGGRTFVPGTNDPSDDNGHGTHCAGTIAAAINGRGVIGVAPAAELYAVKVLGANGSGRFGWIGAGVEWAVQSGIDILSLSLGASAMPETVRRVFDAAARKGVLLVAAAGNDALSVDFPAKLDSCIAVSAIDSRMRLASFSNRGPEVELCAPGVEVLSTWPGGGYRYSDGTSMATPAVSGAAAIAWATHRFADASRVRKLLRDTARPMPGPKEHFGSGLVNAFAAARARG